MRYKLVVKGEEPEASEAAKSRGIRIVHECKGIFRGASCFIVETEDFPVLQGWFDTTDDTVPQPVGALLYYSLE